MRAQEELLAQAHEQARFIAASSITVTSPDREVTVTVGAGGQPQKLELTPAALTLSGRRLAHIITATLVGARTTMERQQADRLGPTSRLLSGDFSWQPDDADEIDQEGPDVLADLPELKALEAQMQARLAASSAIQARSFVVKGEGMEVKFRGTAVVGVALDDAAVRPGVAELLLALIQSGAAEAARQLADQVANLMGGAVDVRHMVEKYAPRRAE